MTSTAAARSSPECGDIVWVDLDPVKGSEQAGQRQALVISETEYNRTSNHVIICPITSNRGEWPTKIPIPEGMPIRGAVLVDQVRSLDRRHRGFRFVCRAPAALVDEVRRQIAALLGIEQGQNDFTP
jgi:mRNA interferase MazF